MQGVSVLFCCRYGSLQVFCFGALALLIRPFANLIRVLFKDEAIKSNGTAKDQEVSRLLEQNTSLMMELESKDGEFFRGSTYGVDRYWLPQWHICVAICQPIALHYSVTPDCSRALLPKDFEEFDVVGSP